MIVLQLNEGQDPGSSANRTYEIINRKYKDQVKGQPYITAEFARDESRIFSLSEMGSTIPDLLRLNSKLIENEKICPVSRNTRQH